MDPAIKARWVAALRSGKYLQTKERLRGNGGHCCLGVLCDLFAQEAGKPWRTKELSEAGRMQNYEGKNYPDVNMPGAFVTVWAQIDPYAKVSIRDEYMALYEHNDAGRTFAEIADAIEAQL
jgi:hypothetical protein